MGAVTVADVTVTPLAKIPTAGGDVWHGLRAADPEFAGFGEAYFSWVSGGAVKAWKRHTRMTMNLIVPVGSVRFAFSDDGHFVGRVEDAGSHRYVRLTVPPGIWFGFQGRDPGASAILNIASIRHDPAEVERCGPTQINYDWTTP